jgi:hypothetical protein
MNTTKVYVIRAGSYSDLRVDRVFSTKEKADDYYNYKSQFSGCDVNDPDAFELDEPFEKEEVITVVKMYSDGGVHHINFHQPNGISRREGGPSGFFNMAHDANGDYIIWGVVTDDEERAIKVVNEKRTWLMANLLWGKSNNKIIEALNNAKIKKDTKKLMEGEYP